MASYLTRLRIPIFSPIITQCYRPPPSNPVYRFLQNRFISTTQSLLLSKKYRKHLRPDGPTGPQRGTFLRDEARRPKSSRGGGDKSGSGKSADSKSGGSKSGGSRSGGGKSGGSRNGGGKSKYIPVKQRLEPIKSDVRRPAPQRSVSDTRLNLVRPSSSRSVSVQKDKPAPPPSVGTRSNFQRRSIADRQIRPETATAVPTEPVFAETEPWEAEKIADLAQRVQETRFETFGFRPEVLQALMECVLMNVPDPRPTEIQALAIPELLRQKNPYILCAAETGSGKTLTYLLPIIHHLKQQEQRAASDPGQARRLRRLEHPRAIVLVPSRELSAQLLAVCKALSHVAKFRVMALTNDSRHELVRRLSTGPIDLLISTPTTLLSYVHADTISLASTRHLVLDEADSLFDSGWGTECREIISTIQCIADREGVSHQVVIVSATLPRSVNKVLDEILPGIRKITTPSLHRPLPSLRQLFVDLKSFKGNRQLALLDVLKRNRRDHKTMIFCNTKTSATLLRDKLAALGIPALALYKDAPSREETLRMFAEKVEPEGEDAKAAYRANNILVCTDVASRGVDTTYVDHVVLYDFPTTVVDYLHRVGRTARAGKKGTVTALVGMKDKVLADRIRKARRLGTVLS